MKRALCLLGFGLVITVLFSLVHAESVARIRAIEGKLTVMKSGSDSWRDAKVNMPLNVGDIVYTRKESFAEILYITGAILRMDENTRITLDEVTVKGTKTSSSVGNIWVNMKKMFSSSKEFTLSSPTATAAIRGTVFHMKTAADSSTDVTVHRGKVAVGPSTNLAKRQSRKANTKPANSYEVQGPVEVPGPYEVTLDQWRTITAGQIISVRKDGKFSEKKFDVKKAFEDAFISKNQVLDKKVAAEDKQ